MATNDSITLPSYNSMQAQAGLLPPSFAPPIYTSQVSSAIAQGGFSAVGSITTAGSPGTSFGAGLFGAQQLQSFTTAPPMVQGPTGVMMPLMPGASNSPYASMNPYAGLAAMGLYAGPPGLYTPMAPAPPPVYGGQWGRLPLGPELPAPHFNTAYMMELDRAHLTENVMEAQTWAAMGVGARIGTNAFAGLGGAALGRKIGGLFGPRGRAAGAFIGGILGFLGSEYIGLGNAGQNAFMNFVASPHIHQQAMAGSIMESSRHYVNIGSALHDSGAGFDHHSALLAANRIRDLANSRSFKHQTGDRFNQADLYLIANEAAHNDLLFGVQSPDQLVGRVRDIAKQLHAFMSLAQEPDVRRAIQTMGQLQSSGLDLAQTMQAVQNGRIFARLAGTTFAEFSNSAGAMGSQTFQSMGLTQGLGLQTGMMHTGLAYAARAGGMDPRLLNLVGGVQGLGALNTMFSGSMLQMPMLAPSVMSSAAGIDANALVRLLSGNTNAFAQTGQATAALQAIVARQGVAGLGAAIAMQPLIQDTIGSMLHAQGPFAMRNFEDQNILNTMRQMGQSGSAGFMTMAQIMGMQGPQAVARARELASPAYFERQRAQIEVNRREARRAELDAREAMAPSFGETMMREMGVDLAYLGRDVSRAVAHTLGDDHHAHYSSTTDEELRRDRAVYNSRAYARFMERLSRQGAAHKEHTSFSQSIGDQLDLARAEGFSGLGAYLAVGLGVGIKNTQRRLSDYREGSRIAGLLASTTLGESNQATDALERFFGREQSAAVQQRLSEAVARRLGDTGPFGSLTAMSIYNTVSSAVGAGDLFQSRQLSGSYFRDAFIRQAMAAGKTREEALEYYRQNVDTVVQGMSATLQTMLTPEQRQALFENARRTAASGTGRGGFSEALEEAEKDLRERLFGRDSAEIQDAFSHHAANIEGLGREGTEENRKSRSYIIAASMLSARLRAVGMNTPEGERLLRQLRELRQAAERSGVNTSRAQTQITGAADRLAEGVGADMARMFAQTHMADSGRALLEAVEQGEEKSRMLRGARREAAGFAALAAGSGELATALRAAGAGDVSTYNRERVIAAIEGLSLEAVNALPEPQRALVRAIRRGGDEGERALARLGQAYGLRAEALRREYHKRGQISRWWSSLWGDTEDKYVNEGLQRLTLADLQADNQLTSTNATENAAQQAGIGSSNDPMLDAARELRQAAQALQSIAQGAQLEYMINGTR